MVGSGEPFYTFHNFALCNPHRSETDIFEKAGSLGEHFMYSIHMHVLVHFVLDIMSRCLAKELFLYCRASENSKHHFIIRKFWFPYILIFLRYLTIPCKRNQHLFKYSCNLDFTRKWTLKLKIFPVSCNILYFSHKSYGSFEPLNIIRLLKSKLSTS